MMSKSFSFRGSCPHNSCKEFQCSGGAASLPFPVACGAGTRVASVVSLFPGVIPWPSLRGCVWALLCGITNRAVRPLVPTT